MNARPLAQKRPFFGGRTALFFLALLLLAESCRRNDAPPTPAATDNPVARMDASVATAWANMTLQLVSSTPGFTPPVASRALGYVGLTLYESLVPGMTDYQSLVGQLNGLAALPKNNPTLEYHWGVSANAAQASIIRNLFANTTAANKTKIDSLEAAFINTYRVREALTQVVYDRSAKFGQDVATALWEWSKTDKGHEGYSRNFPTTYVPPVGAGKWKETGSGKAMQPYWGQNRTFLAANASMTMPTPLAYATRSTSQYFVQFLEVYSVGRELTNEQKQIAYWWADGGGTITPPGHSYSLASIAVRKSGAKLDKAAETYARLGISLADAFILCWKCKFTYNTERPVTYIKALIDPAWTSLITTPPFPEFTSGHSTQSGATAEVLTYLYGNNFAFTDSTHVGRAAEKGLAYQARKFDSFYEAADEAAISRLYGGIHIAYANETGLREGKKLGRNILAMKFKRQDVK